MAVQFLVERALVDAALVAHLGAVLGVERVGWRSRPAGTLDVLAKHQRFPYYVVEPIEGGEWSGPPLAGPHTDPVFVYQVNAAGERDDQAQVAATLARRALLGLLPAGAPGRPLRDVAAPDGSVHCRVARVEPDTSPTAPEGSGSLWTVSDRYRVSVTP